MPVRSVAITGYQDIPYDQMYWMKNSVASIMGFPLPELSVSGGHMFWHMFSCFNIAMFHFSTGVEIFSLCFALSYVWHGMLLMGSVYALSDELLTDRRYIFLALILILFCSSAEYVTDVLYLVHLWYCTMGTPEAIAMELLALLLLLKSIEGMRVHWRLVPVTVLTVVAAVGYKSPVGVVLLVGVGVMLVVLALRDRRAAVSSLVLLAIVALLSIAVVKIFVASGDTLSSSTSNNQISLTFRTATQPEVMQYMVGILTDLGMEIHVTAVLLSIPYLLLSHPSIPLMATCLVALLLVRQRIDLLDDGVLTVLLPLLAMCLAGMSAFLAFTHYGFAQSYFIYASIPLAVLFSLVAIEHYLSKCHSRCISVLCLWTGLSLVAMPLCAMVYEQSEEFRHEAPAVSREGTSLTVREWEGLVWAREHLPASAVILTNKVLAPARGNRSYVTSAYAERQVYFEGYISANLPNDHIINDRLELITRYFSGDPEAREVLRKEGVTHVVIYKALVDVDRVNVSWGGKTRVLVFRPLSNIGTDLGTVLFENEEIKVMTL